MNLFVRTSGEPLQVLGAIREVVRELNPEVPVTDVATAHDLVDDALATPRNLAGAVGAFAAVALLLAMIGIYGVMSYFVNEHRKDIGIRLALGGKPGAVLGLVLARGLRPVLFGTAIGFVLALVATRFMTRMLFGVSPHDPATLGMVALAMLGTAIAACWIPARHAARLDPARVLRHD
jgi:ABC-type antimicrobial peptide transport system permease subunit